MNWVQLGGSIVAILILAGMAWALGLGGAPITDEAQAMRAAEDALPGFMAESAVLGLDGNAAIVRGQDGDVAVVKRHGAHPAVRRVPHDAVRASAGGWTVESGERRFGTVLVRTNLGSG